MRNVRKFWTMLFVVLVLAGVAWSGELIVDQKNDKADDKNPGSASGAVQDDPGGAGQGSGGRQRGGARGRLPRGREVQARRREQRRGTVLIWPQTFFFNPYPHRLR